MYQLNYVSDREYIIPHTFISVLRDKMKFSKCTSLILKILYNLLSTENRPKTISKVPLMGSQMLIMVTFQKSKKSKTTN